jgi:outer membrane autotransporter protein
MIGAAAIGATPATAHCLHCDQSTPGETATESTQVALQPVATYINGIVDQIQLGNLVQTSAPLGFAPAPDESRLSGFSALAYTARRGAAPARGAPPALAAPSPVLYAVWGMGLADYEKRTGMFAGTDIGRKTNTYGGLVGFDAIIRNVVAPQDALVLGVLAGGISSRVRNNSGSTVDLDGPGVGIYGAYVVGPWSIDGVFKVDFYDITQTVPPAAPLGLGLTSYSTAFNLNYKINFGAWWLEPTGGIVYTRTIWDSPSHALGYQDGTTMRLQAGARAGWVTMWNGIRVQPTLTARIYSDVRVDGGSVVVPLGGIVPPSDEGKVFGLVAGKLNFVMSSRFSAYVEGEVRGRSHVVGLGARGGIRYALQ